DKEIPNPRKNSPPQSVLGGVQKAWFLERLREARTAWKFWGNSIGMLDSRTDLQNLPPDLVKAWPVKGYGTLGGDWTAYRTERAEILDFIKREKITGVVTIAGDRHSFFAGLLSATMPPKSFEPVAAEFITASISAPGLVEAIEHNVPKDHPLRSLFLFEPSSE